MKRGTASFLIAMLFLFPVSPAVAQEDEGNPHLMLDENGEPRLDKCGFCHDDDLTLLQSKEDTCTACHSAAQHAGSSRHLSASPEAVARVLPNWKEDEKLVFTDNGGIYCGTCHLFHDQKDESEPWLASGCKERTTEFSAAVRRDVEQQRDSIADAQAAHIVAEGTRALRYPVCDGTLCRHCHKDLDASPRRSP